MKTIITFLLLIISLLAVGKEKVEAFNRYKPATKDTFQLLAFYPGEYIDFEVDATENIYVVSKSGQLKKYSTKGDSIAVFNDVKRYGNISYLDVSNPLKTIVYFKNFTTAITLDRLLANTNTLNLRKQQIFKVSCITSSYDNNFWIFDEQDMRLKKISDDNTTLLESIDVRVLTETPSAINYIRETGNYVYLYDNMKGWYLFDRYAAFIKYIPEKNWKSANAIDQNIAGIRDNTLHVVNCNTLAEKDWQVPVTEAINKIRFSINKITLLTEKGISVYKMP